MTSTLEDTATVDPASLAPLCGEAQFTKLMEQMVTDEAPHLFAVVQVYGERADGRIAAWGMGFPEHAEIVGVDGHTRMSLCSPELAVRGFTRRPHVTAHVV